MREKVRKKYAELALASQAGDDASCCGVAAAVGFSGLASLPARFLFPALAPREPTRQPG